MANSDDLYMYTVGQCGPEVIVHVGLTILNPGDSAAKPRDSHRASPLNGRRIETTDSH